MFAVFCVFCALFNTVMVPASTPKTLLTNTNEKKEVIACGYPVGLYLKYDGVLIAKIGSFTGSGGMTESPCKGKLKQGDIILELDGIKIESKEQFTKLVGEKGNESMVLKVRRSSEDINVKVTPSFDKEGASKLGIWVRDDTQGIGTITYITKNGEFGALGHGVNDIDTGNVVPICGGKLYEATIMYIRKGKNGTPGEFIGAINYSKEYELGVIEKNTVFGIFGRVNEVPNEKTYEVAKKYDVKEGEAYIISYADGTRREYSINITEVDVSNDNINKGIKYVVTDEKLLEITNGIVQGMSGSPIIQENKLIGAVTHVFVNDSTKGYGIFIEKMLEN